MLQPAFPPKLDSAVNLVNQGGTAMRVVVRLMVVVMMAIMVVVVVVAMVVIFYVRSNPNWSPSQERKQEDLV